MSPDREFTLQSSDSRLHLAKVILLTSVISLGSCIAPQEDIAVIHEPIRVCADGPTLDGIDVSHHQGAINWERVAGSGIDFAFIRVSDGFSQDRRFDENWPEARRVGVLRGVYQYFRPGRDAVEQADLLLRRMGPLEPDDLPPVIDVEATDGYPAAHIAAGIRQWVDRVQIATGRTPIIYSGMYFWRDEVGGPRDFIENPLWIAQYGRTCPDIPAPWEHWAFWQTSDTGRVAGISGAVDTDLFNGDLDALLALTAVGGCGDGSCDTREDSDTCPADCPGPACGDGTCDAGEDSGGCPEDCPVHGPFCGDGTCADGEDPTTCFADCPACATVPPAGRIVDESELCFEALGPSVYWRNVSAGWDGSLLWTYTTSSSRQVVHAYWRLDVEEAGTYRIETYTDRRYASSRSARYEVRHNGRSDVITVNQTTVDGWTLVSELELAAGGDQWVHLADNTGERSSTGRRVVFDALRLTRTYPPLDHWIGEPCSGDADCASGLCFTEDATGYPEGMCTQACDRYCPDRPEHPVTFCTSLSGSGTCFARQDTAIFPGSGCRPGYHAERVQRYRQPSTYRTVCVPDGVAPDGRWGGWVTSLDEESSVIDETGAWPSDLDDPGDDTPESDPSWEDSEDNDEAGSPDTVEDGAEATEHTDAVTPSVVPGLDGSCGMSRTRPSPPIWVLAVAALPVIGRRVRREHRR